MVNYNLTPLQGNESGIVTLIQVTNDATQGLLVGGFVLVLFIVQASVLTKFNTGVLGAATFSGWLCFIYSALLVLAGLLSFWFPLGFGVLSAFGLWGLYLQK